MKMENAKNMPALRFAEFSEAWEMKKFKDVYSFRVTNSFSRENLNYENGLVKNIHYGDIHTKFATFFDITKEKVPFINTEINIHKIAIENYLKEGDLIFADASEDLNDVGKHIEIVQLNNEKLLSGLHTILARQKNIYLSIGFAACLFKSNKIRLQIQKETQGTKVCSISASRLSNIELFFPTLPEQQKIASFFTTIDEKLSQLKKKKNLLESYKKGMMQAIFSKKLRFKDDEGNDFEDWKIKRLGDFAEIYDGTHQTPIYVEEGIPFYSVEQITANDFQKTKFISKEVFEKENKRVKIEKGDILMTRIGDVGTSKYIDWDVNASFYVSIVLIKQSTKYNSKYLNQFISSKFFQNELWNRMIHVAFPKKINLGEIGNCLVKLPCLSEQKKIAHFLSAIDERINCLSNEIQQMEIWKKGLLQQMFV